MPDDWCAYCFGPLGEGKTVEKNGRRYHPGHEKADKLVPLDLTTAEGVKVGGRGADAARHYDRTKGWVREV